MGKFDGEHYIIASHCQHHASPSIGELRVGQLLALLRALQVRLQLLDAMISHGLE